MHTAIDRPARTRSRCGNETTMKTDLLDIRHADCMYLMREYPDGHFSLAIVDPEYGIGASEMQMGKGKDQQWTRGKKWDAKIPEQSYFDELKRVSEKQIIWGGNYFPLPLTGGWLFWDKDKGKDVSFADGELAWTSFLTVLKKATIRYDGFIGADLTRIHPTQKPVKLYEWILRNYAKPGDTILDTHMGSGSIAIACHYAGHNLTACELDADYYAAGCERVMRETQQTTLF